MTVRSIVLAGLAALGLGQPQRAAAQDIDPRLAESIEWYTGVAGTVDDERAADLLRQAVADEDPVSVMWLARVHSTGRMGFEEDPDHARALANGVIEQVRALADQDLTEAEFLMGTAYAEGLGVELDPVEAVAWYRKAASDGHVLAQHNLGNVHFAGTGVEQSDSLAVAWWLQAAQQGDAIPALRLGMMYEEGRGVAADLDEARRWYQESAARGNAAAAAALDRLATR
jgi:TPR repeat protein